MAKPKPTPAAAPEARAAAASAPTDLYFGAPVKVDNGDATFFGYPHDATGAFDTATARILPADKTDMATDTVEVPADSMTPNPPEPPAEEPPP
jgi:hypothetical protein